MLQFWRKKTTTDHTLWLFDRARGFWNETIILCGERGLRGELQRPIVASLPIAALNEMFVHGPLNRSDWPIIKQGLENQLAYSMLTTPNAIDSELQKNPEAFHESFREVCQRSCAKQLMLSRALFKDREPAGQAEAESRFIEFISIWLKEDFLPDVDDNKLLPLVHPICQSYLKFHLKAVQYVKTHFA